MGALWEVYKGWAVEEIENLLKAVRTQSSKGL